MGGYPLAAARVAVGLRRQVDVDHEALRAAGSDREAVQEVFRTAARRAYWVDGEGYPCTERGERIPGATRQCEGDGCSRRATRPSRVLTTWDASVWMWLCGAHRERYALAPDDPGGSGRVAPTST